MEAFMLIEKNIFISTIQKIKGQNLNIEKVSHRSLKTV